MATHPQLVRSDIPGPLCWLPLSPIRNGSADPVGLSGYRALLGHQGPFQSSSRAIARPVIALSITPPDSPTTPPIGKKFPSKPVFRGKTYDVTSKGTIR